MPETNTPVTATKANVASAIAALGAALVTLLLFWAGPAIGLAAPDQAEAASAFTVVVTTLATAAATAIPTWIGAYFATNKPKGDAPHGGGVQSPAWAGLAAVALALLLTACAADPKTGEPRTPEERMQAGLAWFTLAAEVLAVAAPDETAELDANVTRGITVYCGLSPASQALMIEGIDPAILAYAVRRYGGDDGDVCDDT